MKKTFLSLALVLAVGSVAQAARFTMTIGETGYLGSCGGQISINNGGSDDQVNVVLRNVKNCSNFDILTANGDSVYYDSKKIPGTNGNRDGSFSVPSRFFDYGSNTVRVQVRSNSAEHSDIITIKFRNYGGSTGGTGSSSSMEISMGQTKRLPSCGGTISINNGGNDDQVNVVFRSVDNCSNFDILSANGEPVAYENKKLQQTHDGRGGSFTIPSRYYDWGRNTVKIRVNSNSNKHQDTVKIKFRNY